MEKKIVFVSRLDRDCSVGAHLLCDVAKRLSARYGKIEITIVGSGEEFPTISSRARKINAEIEKELPSAPTKEGRADTNLPQNLGGREHLTVNAVGGTEDPSRYLDKNALFVGVSRCALEAMGRGLPVILLGNEGYLGLFDESKLAQAEKTNFTCRAQGKIPSREVFYAEICRYFDLPEEEKKNLRALSCHVIDKKYGADKMAQETLDFYKETLDFYKETLNFHRTRVHKTPAPFKITLCGYYGRGNFGDEAILSVLLEKIRSIRSADGHGRTEICVIKDKNILSLINKLWRADLFVFGGGSLLQNTTSSASLIYYLLVLQAAAILCRHKIILANGIGPILGGAAARKFWLSLIGTVLREFDALSVRDELSRATLRTGMPDGKIELLADPTFVLFSDEAHFLGESSSTDKSSLPDKSPSPESSLALEDAPSLKSAQSSSQSPSLKGTPSHAESPSPCATANCEKNLLIYCPCSRGAEKANLTARELASALDSIAKSLGLTVTVAVLSKSEDMALAQKIKTELKDARTVCVRDAKYFKKLLSRAALTVSQRYHGALFSLCLGVPTLALSCDPKLTSLCEQFNAPHPRDISILNSSAGANKLTALARSAVKGARQSNLSAIERARTLGKGASDSLEKILRRYI